MQINEIKISHHGRTIDGTFYKPEGLEKFPVVIFSHGFNGDPTDFDISAKYFALNGIGAVCYTFCGGSLRDVSGFATTDMTLFTEKEDLCAVIDEVKKWVCTDESNIYLFGASQGGMVSALTAEEREKDIKGLVLLCPALCIPDDWNKRFPNEEDIPDVYDLWGMAVGRKYFETVHNFDINEHIGRFKKKVLIMHGTEDKTVPVSYAIWAAEKYKDARLEVFHEEGHSFSEAGSRRMEAMALYFIHSCIQ